MEEQKYEIKNAKSFEPQHIFECGQCFRWNIQEDGSYTGVVGNNVLNVKKIKKDIIITGKCEEDISLLINQYFDLNTDYEQIKEKLSNIDNFLKTSIEYGKGIRILNQDIWETLISFIISANNNIPRIKRIIESICKNYGDKITWKQKEYYTFPTPKQLSKASVEELRKIGLGFRDIRVFETTKMVQNGKFNVEQLVKMKNINELKEELLKFPGVGPKVADCIMLFSMQKKEVFPIDVWVKRVMTELYSDEIKLKNKDTEKNIALNNKQILNFAQKKFGKLAGIAQQYLFYWRRSQE